MGRESHTPEWPIKWISNSWYNSLPDIRNILLSPWTLSWHCITLQLWHPLSFPPWISQSFKGEKWVCMARLPCSPWLKPLWGSCPPAAPGGPLWRRYPPAGHGGAQAVTHGKPAPWQDLAEHVDPWREESTLDARFCDPWETHTVRNCSLWKGLHYICFVIIRTCRPELFLKSKFLLNSEAKVGVVCAHPMTTS